MRASFSLLILPLVALLVGGAARDLSNRAKANLAALVSAQDYPMSAIRAGEQGVVGFQLDVAADGRVTACRVTSSSGSATLDAATCRIMVVRAHFTPAHDRKGRPTTDRVRNRMRWVLPQAELPQAGLPQLESGEAAIPAVPADEPVPVEESNGETPAEPPPS